MQIQFIASFRFITILWLKPYVCAFVAVCMSEKGRELCGSWSHLFASQNNCDFVYFHSQEGLVSMCARLQAGSVYPSVRGIWKCQVEVGIVRIINPFSNTGRDWALLSPTTQQVSFAAETACLSASCIAASVCPDFAGMKYWQPG